MKKLLPSVNIESDESVNACDYLQSLWKDAEFCRRLTEIIFSTEWPEQ